MKKVVLTFWLSLFYIIGLTQPVEIKILLNSSSNFTKAGSLIYFSSGDTLWKSDGTTAGTVIVKVGLNQPTNFKASNNLLFFVTGSNQLWKSDGTNAGTIFLKSFSVGEINYIQTIGSYLFFTARDGTTGRELYRSDGTVSGTILLKDIYPGSGDGVGTTGYVPVGNLLYFPGTDPTHGKELWRTDGTTAGTLLLKDVNPGSANGFSSGPWALAGKVYFGANDGTHGNELWVTNGTTAGTIMVKDINPGPESGFSNRTPVGTSTILYFLTPNDQIWKTNGTEAGTALVKDFSSISEHESTLQLLYTKNDSLYFFIYEVFNDVRFELWKSGGTEASTVLYSSLPFSSSLDLGINYTQNVVVLDGRAYVMLSISGNTAASLLVTDGTDHGSFTTQVAGGGDVVTTFITTLNHNVIYSVTTQNQYFPGFYKSDGTVSGTGFFTSGSDRSGHDFTTIGNLGFFVLDEFTNTRNPDELWETDLTTSQTLRSIYGVSLPNSGNLINLNNVLYFTSLNNGVLRFWKFDPNSKTCVATGQLIREVWNNISGSTVSSIPYTTKAPDNIDTVSLFEGPTNVGNLYGARYRGYVCVPITGNYTFWIASDDNSELWLSTDDNPNNRVRIAYVNGWTYPRTYNKYPSQQSAPIALIASKKYYIEALHKEAYGNDNLSVGWQLPNGTLERPIPGFRLSAFINKPPVVSITQPAPDQSFNAPANVTITASASDPDGFITKVEFYSNNVLVGTDVSAPYSITLSNLPSNFYTLKAIAYDNDGALTRSMSVSIRVGECLSSGDILREYWANVPGSTVSTIPVNTPPTSTSTVTIFEGPTNVANLYGARYRGYICVPTTGNYTFWIASDDDSELLLSTDSDPSHKTRIAYVNGWTYPRTYNKYPSQQSAPIHLEEGNTYYIEALHKEAYGNDNLSVGWQLPDGTLERPIPGFRLKSFTSPASVSMTKAASDEEVTGPANNDFQVTILPNPTGKGILTVLIEGVSSSLNEVTVNISNLQGYNVYNDQKSFEDNTCSLSITIDNKFPPGMYIVQILINGKVYVERLVVE